MQISETIGNEAMFFQNSVLCGIGLVLVYDCFRIFRRVVPHGNIWIGIEDVCYWIFCTVTVFLHLYRNNDGMIRSVCFLGIGIGCMVYMLLCSRLVVKIAANVLGKILKGIRKVLGILLVPFVRPGKKMISFIRKQLKKLYKAIKMSLRKL